MSNDLISRESVLKFIENIKINPEIPKNYGTLLDIMREIRKIPTAYDMDKVVEQIKKIMEDESIRFVDQAVNRSVNIVKSGGIE